MKKNLQQPKPNQETTQNLNSKYFKVFYSKDVNKKKKTFSQGILAWENKKIRLYNSDGQLLTQVNQKNQPELNEEYVLGYKFAVFVESEIDKQTFTSGRVFIALVDGSLKPVPSASSTNTINHQAKPAQKKQLRQKLAQKQTTTHVLNPAKFNQTNKETTQLQNGLIVENIIYSKLREHQIEGVQFMYNCLMGYKSPSICGCILADFMGLGKTLQTITLIYCLLKMKKIAKCVVISPLTLVYVWQKECKKWLDNKLCPLIALGDGEEVKNVCKQFANNQYRMLVLSYQGFYRFIDIIDRKCDLIVFDQGHRLKNKNSKVYKKILHFSCRKRVLLTGTPLQNNLEQLYTCISIVNPSLFASDQLFKNVFQKPILNGMAKKATQIERKIAIQRTKQLANKIKEFSLRRKADTLQKYLPIKRQYFVLFKLTPLQKIWYERLLKRKQSQSDVLGFLNLFRKLFTHPQILKNDRLDKFDTAQFTQQSMEEISYKMNFVLDVCKKEVSKKEKVIVVSYFTSTLDFISKILRDNEISYIKLDGKVDGKDREVVVGAFEKEKSVLLLSGKAGGTGLTLVSARTMVILQPDWNPSNDTQVIGRIWRQGQNQQVSIYRLVIISSFEERIVERQQLKNALSQKLIDENKSTQKGYDFLDMKKLFVQCSQKSIFFKESENILDKVYSSSGLQWEGVVMSVCRISHNQQNSEQNLTFKQNKSKAVAKDQNNEFADGLLLFEGLIQDGEQSDQDKTADCEQEDEAFNQINVYNRISCRKQIQSELQTNSQELQVSQQKNSIDILPVKRQLKAKPKNQNDIYLQKQVQPKYQKLQPTNLHSKLQTKNPKKLKKYQIVNMEDYIKFNLKANHSPQQSKSTQLKQYTEFNSGESLNINNEMQLNQTLTNIKDKQIKSEKLKSNQQKESQSASIISQNSQALSQKNLEQIQKTNQQGVGDSLNQKLGEQNGDEKSKKGNYLVLNKLKLKKKTT